MKSYNALKYVQLTLIVVVVIMLALSVTLVNTAIKNSNEQQDQNENNDPNENLNTAPGKTFCAIGFAIMLIIIFITLIPVGIALLTTDICLFAVKKKLGAAIASLVVVCIFAPLFICDEILYFSLTSLAPQFVVLPIVGAALYAATFVFDCIAIDRLRKARKTEQTV